MPGASTPPVSVPSIIPTSTAIPADVKVAVKTRVASEISIGVGITYEQMTAYLDKFFDMKDVGPLANGKAHYMAQSENKLEMLEVIGNKSDISSATLAFGVANDATPEQRATEVGCYLRFLKNCDASWSGATNWGTQAMKSVTTSAAASPSVMTFRGQKKIEVSYVKSLSLLSITVSRK